MGNGYATACEKPFCLFLQDQGILGKTIYGYDCSVGAVTEMGLALHQPTRAVSRVSQMRLTSLILRVHLIPLFPRAMDVDIE